jgi:hypothetical protein
LNHTDPWKAPDGVVILVLAGGVLASWWVIWIIWEAFK